MLAFCAGVGSGETGFQELAEAEDRVERGAKLVAHAGKEIRFGEVGLFRDGFGAGQFRFDLPALGQVPGQLGETARIAGLVRIAVNTSFAQNVDPSCERANLRPRTVP